MDKFKEILEEKRKLMDKASIILIDNLKLKKIKESR